MPDRTPVEPLAAFHYLGPIDFDASLALQARLVYEAGERTDGRITVLLCEHPPLITVGRSGSRAHIRLTPRELRQQQLRVQWVGRGGGCVLHHPGQLACYPIVPLAQRAWSVGAYLERFRRGLKDALAACGVRASASADRPGLWGRTGLLASLGVAVRHDVALHGAWLNISPFLHVGGRIDAVPPHTVLPGQKTPLSSLLAERHEPVTMTSVRAALVAGLAAAFDCPRQLVTTGHPLYASPGRLAAASFA